MKKRIMAVALVLAVLALGLAGCKGEEGAEPQQETESEAGTGTEAAAEIVVHPGYRTVTETMDWGPAITKVILDMGVAVDEGSVDAGAFSVSCERKAQGLDQTARRIVSACYVSDAEGNRDADGAYITIEMEVGPGMTGSSPLNYDPGSGLNKYVKTTYLVRTAEGAVLRTKDGESLVVEETGASDNQGNINVIADAFDCTGSYRDEAGRITLRYASYMPGQAREGETPLIIWLHGAGEGGKDPVLAIMGNKVVNLATEDIQQYFGETGAAILAPQAPTMWMDNGRGYYMDTEDPGAGTSYYTEALMGLIEAYVAEHGEIDADRVYIGGCSNGGYMTINMLIEYPGYFAAAYPVCEAYAPGWLSDERLAALKDAPIWLTAARTDNVIDADEYSGALYDRLAQAGAQDIHYSLFEKVVDTSGNYLRRGNAPYEYQGHYSWIYTLNNECVEEIGGEEVSVFEWLSWHAR